MISNKLRIGIIINGNKVPNWIFLIIQRISQSNNSEIVVAINTGEKPAYKVKKGNWVLQKFIAFDRKSYQVKHDATKLRSLLDIPTYSEIKSMILVSDGQCSSKDKSRIRDLKLDVLLKLDTTSTVDQFNELARFGIWFHYVGNFPDQLPILNGVQEFLENQYVTKITLASQIGDASQPVRLFESYSRTDHHSIYRSLNNSYWKAASFIPRKLQELHQRGAIDFFKSMDNRTTPPLTFYVKPYTVPTAPYLVRRLLKHLFSKISGKISEKQYFDQWILLFKIRGEEGISTTFFEFTRMTPPKDRFWGDPFVIYKNNTNYIFLEELIYKNGLGTIVVIEMDEQGNYKPPQLILEKEYHMSYPFLIEDQGKLYMLPETKGNRTIELYECTDFPLKWKPKEILFNNIRAVDSTILKHNRKYWLFTNIQENEGTFTSDDELFLFYSDSLLNGNWTPHMQNPIVSDVRTSRPAGKIIVRNGRLFRPAQNCAKHYGHGMQLQEIITLTETEYKEINIQSIYPEWDSDIISTHTINCDSRLTLIDAKIKRRRS